MPTIKLNERPLDTSALQDTDRMLLFPAAGFSDPATGTQDERDAIADGNREEFHSLSALRSYFQQGIPTSVPDAATDTTAGIVELATAAETRAGTDATRAVTPAGANAAISAAIAALTIPAGTFVGLTDTPGALGSNGQFLGVSGGALAFVDAPDAPDGGLQAVHSDASLSGQGTSASPLAVANPFTAADESKLDGIEANATADQTGGEIVTLLSNLSGGARLPISAISGYSPGDSNVQPDWGETDTTSHAFIRNKPSVITAAERSKLAGIAAGAEVNVQADWNAGSGDAQILNKPTIPAEPTTQSVTGLLRAFPALTTLDAADTLFGYDASSSQGVEITLQSLAGYVEGTLDIPDAEVDEFQFAVATISQGLGSNDAFANTPAGSSNTRDLSFASVRDDASLGFTDASGRLSFGNTHTDRDTNLIITGRIPVQHSGLGGRLRVYFREYLSGSPDTVNREVVVADHPITESASTRTFHFPVTGTQVRVRRSRTYKIVMEFSAVAGTAPNGLLSLLYSLDDDANLIAFNRFQLSLTDLIDTPAALGTAGQILAVNSETNALEFIDAPSGGGQTATELFSTLRTANAPTGAPADADSLFGWDAGSGRGAEFPLSTLRTYMQTGIEAGASNFLSLTDTPSAFGSEGQTLVVNEAGDALEFADAPSGGGGGESISDNLLASPVSIGSSQTRTGILLELDEWYILKIATGRFSPVEYVWIKYQEHNSFYMRSSGAIIDLVTVQTSNLPTGDETIINTGQFRSWTLDAVYKVTFGAGSSSGGGGASAFTGLTDTPETLGTAGQIPAVNAGGTALEFIDAPNGTFPSVTALPAPTALGMTAFLTGFDSTYHQAPGLKRTATNPISPRNRSMLTVGADPLASNVFGASINPAGRWGDIPNTEMVGQVAWSTAVPRYVNVYLNTALTGNETTLYLDFGSSEFSTDITRRLRFNRGTNTSNFTANGKTYRAWTVDTTEHDQSDDEVVQRLMELQDASGNNDITIDIYTSASGDTPLNHIPEFVWRDLEAQTELKQKIEVPAAQRVLLAKDIFADNNQLKTYNTDALLTADINNLIDGEVVRVRNRTPGSADSNSNIYVIEGRIAGTDGKKGAVSHRNRTSVRLLPMAHGLGFYYTANVRSALRTFNNVASNADIDPNNRIGFISFYNSGGAGNRPYVQVGIAPALTTRNSIALIISNRETSAGANAPQLDVDVTRTGNTANFANTTYNVYQYDLNAAQAQQLAGGWIFRDEILVMDVLEDHLRSESAINFNPDEVQFTSGSGYAAHTDAVAARTRNLIPQWETIYTRPDFTAAIVANENIDLSKDITNALELMVETSKTPSIGNPPDASSGNGEIASQFILPPFFLQNETGGRPQSYYIRTDYGNFTEFSIVPQTVQGVQVLTRLRANNRVARIHRVDARF